MATDPIVFVVDDDAAIRNSLRLILETAGHKAVAFASGEEFLQSLQASQPGCLVLDLNMPGLSGLDIQETLVARGIPLPVIILTGFGEVSESVRAMKAGAVDFVEKPYDSKHLLGVIEGALRRDERFRAAEGERQVLLVRLAQLTPREREVMLRIIEGRTTKQIAAEFGVTTQTIDAHRQRVLQKMDADTTTELVRVSVENRLVEKLTTPPQA